MLLHERLLRVADVTGFDVDGEALATLRTYRHEARFVETDITRAIPDSERHRYELVIAGEVLEHVPDADAFIRATAQLLKPGGRLCVTVPNACCPKIGLRSLAGRESVHPDHRVYYGPRTLTRTLDGAGFEVQTLATYLAPVAGTAGRLLFNPLLKLSHRAFQGPVGDGLIAVARSSASPNASAIAS
jgi:2-polyprenyl-3-methyl-5-hydroxy-6-metoxy-1,4-benzoquinol methylase